MRQASLLKHFKNPTFFCKLWAMRYVLLFFAWLTLCCSSLSANEMPAQTQKDLQISISNSVNISKKKKSSSFTKIKFHSTKARLFFAQSILPDLPPTLKIKPTLPIVVQTIGWISFEKFNYQSIFSYLYPKHAFW